jgi:hypothetical protein
MRADELSFSEKYSTLHLLQQKWKHTAYVLSLAAWL